MSLSSYSYGDIVIAPYQFESILEFILTKELNDHAKLYIRGIVPEEKMDQYVEGADGDEWLEVTLKEGEGTRSLFQGVVTNMTVQTTRNARIMAIEAYSSTFFMDIHKRSRSFQNASMAYQELFAQITGEYADSDVVDQATQGATTGGLLVQYKETDWTFLKRLASHFHAQLAPICGLKGTKFYVGVQDFPARHKLEEFNYAIKKDLKGYRILAANDLPNLDEQDLISYEITSTRLLELGSTVEFKDRKLYVFRAETAMVDGELIHTYILREKSGLSCRKSYNPSLVGASLFGKILDVSKDKVKVKLDIDKGQGTGGSLWFAYSTIYSSPDGSGWYCMPEVGDHIRLYFPDEQERHAFAASSVDTTSSDTSKRSDPSVKSISTKYGKQIVFQPGSVEIMGSGKLLMRLTDDGGIEINSDKKIILSAEGDIEMNGGAKILIQGDEGIDFKQANATISIVDDVTISGGKVNMK
ncbi:phage tail protein [Paenibacillus sp. SYP-B3998]|uniref:Phage tail protein n=1 Tax=Paenibacillus sp. SYP-B3998 TaxID=2678564 RepID=A0A6G4A5Z3_9BACL|nr:contractile injection system protein, VgrG/Pvc8 family [Paenibacillus sp. SYP-B3998]NEW09792.1 phage tail protein [Paenibacillus sp. SYP-B3998]